MFALKTRIRRHRAKVIEAVQARANGYLIKPFDEDIPKQKLTQVATAHQKRVPAL